MNLTGRIHAGVLLFAMTGACGGRAEHAGGSTGALARDPLGACALSGPAAVVELWSPNHKVHLISIDQCWPQLRGCGGALGAAFTWASSDEPIDGIGDGHHAPDVFRVDRTHVCVRAERQGPENGRVYRLGVTDGDVETECIVTVAHDRRGAPAVGDGDRYRQDFDDADDRASCDGELAPPGEDGDAPRPPRPPAPPDDDSPRAPPPPDPDEPADAPPADAGGAPDAGDPDAKPPQ